MLPKVSREELLIDVAETDSGIPPNLADFKLKMMSAVGAKGQGRRAFATKSAHLTTVPLDVSSMSSREQQKYNNLKPYFPYSGKTSSPARQSRAQKQQQSPLWKWRAESSNGYKSEYSYNRVRAHSHSVRSAKTESEMKSMPYLVPRTATSSKPSNKVSLSPDRSVEPVRTRHEKIIKSKPLSAAPTSSTQQNVETPKTQLGEMVMTGSRNAPGIVNTSVSLSTSKIQATRERVHICRTDEEKEKNPESIRLDKSGIRVFPDIGGGESVSLKLLSLQHNLLTRLENVPLLSQLVVLDLYDNRVERITGLQGLPSLRVLLLGKNRIKRIEGLESLKRLEILDLHGNQLRYVDNLGPLTSLRVLNLAGNVLRNIRNLGPYGMSSLTELNLKRNRIKNLEGLQKAPHLKRLLLANNDLQTIASLAPLRKLQYLRELVIEPNPMITATDVGKDYKNQIITLFPNLSSLDRNPVTEEMKTEARIWHRKKLAEEEARKQEEARLREEMSAKVGPPGSREQVIYQARRRWESLKKYVKKTEDNDPPATGKPTQKKLKSMKSIVAAATDKSLPSNVLYPPATLDLEHFPDGRTEFEQTESLMGCVSVGNDDVDELSSSSLARLEVDGEADNAATPALSSSSPEPEQETVQSQDAPTQYIPTSVESQNIPRSVNISDNLGISIQPEEYFSSMNSNADFLEESIHNLPTSENISGEQDGISQSLQVQDNFIFKKESADVTEKQQQYCNSARSPFDSLPSPGSADREKSAKVAVVRPLVREMGCNEELALTVINNTRTQPYTAEQTAILATRIENSELSLYSESDFSSPVKQLLPEINLLESNCEEEYLVKECQPNESKNAEMCNNPNMGHALKANTPDNAVSNPGENKESANSPTTAASIESPNQPQDNRRSKLLKHLRSISLDSYPHQFFQPGKEKADDESTIQLSDDNGEEDDDDNDNEVQDYDCDDAYSIAGSSTTTGTSGGTPGRNTSTITNRLIKGGGVSFRKQTFPRTKSQRIKIRDRAAKIQQSSVDTLRPYSMLGKRMNSVTGAKGTDAGAPPPRSGPGGRILRRCDSAISLSTVSSLGSVVNSATFSGNTNSIKAITVGGGGSTGTVNEMIETRDGNTPLRKQGVDFLVEIEGKVLNVFGQGGLRHALTAFTSNLTCHVCTAKFHYISYDSIIPLFGKLRQVFPSLEHFYFRANNICTLAQLDALSDLQGLTSLSIAKEGNPILSNQAWTHYASYRLSHWGLQVINGKEVCSEYRGALTPAAQAKGFESLGFLALSCLPQTALTPLAKRLHMLHCFCCCSPSTSSDESSKPQRLLAVSSTHNTHQGRAHSPSQQTEHGSAGNFCTAWDDDPVLLDVIGKEALVYCPPPPLPVDGNDDNNGYFANIKHDSSSKEVELKSNNPTINSEIASTSSAHERKRAETLGDLIYSGVEIVEKVDRLEKVWPTLMTEVIQEMLMDFRFMDTYMKKELKKAQDITLINQHHHGSHNQQYPHGRKRH